METVSKGLSKFVSDLHYDDLAPEVIRYSKQLILDTLGVAIGGYTSEPSRIMRRTVKQFGGIPESSIIGSGEKTSSSLAALTNGVMVRYLDFMDIYFSKDACHPSENIPVALAVGERQHSSGKDLLLAIYIGYEIQGRLADVFETHKYGWHHVGMGGFVTPLLAGKLLGLSVDEMVNAMGIAGCSVQTLNYVEGKISMIKALGYGMAAQRGIEASLMALNGMTGQERAIEMFNESAKINADLSSLLSNDNKPKILNAGIKPFAAEFMSHTPLEAMFTLVKENHIKPEDVESMNLKIYEKAMLLAEEETFKPQTREKADHSLPYCLAVGMFEGDLGPAQFSREQWKDPKIIDLMSRIKIISDPTLTEIFPKARPADLEIRTKDGQIYQKRVDFPKGDPKNPMTDEEVQRKFRRLVLPLMPENRIKKIIDCVNDIEQVKDIGELMSLLFI
jgi:2-methylcitrate dehydratase